MKKKRDYKFLKPNLKNIIFALVLLVISFFVFPIPCTTAPLSWPVEEPTLNVCFLRNSPKLAPILGISVNYFGIKSILGEIIGFAFLMLISYLLSSFILSKIRLKK